MRDGSGRRSLREWAAQEKRDDVLKRLIIKLYRFIFRISDVSEDDRRHFRKTIRAVAGEPIEAGSAVYLGKDGRLYKSIQKGESMFIHGDSIDGFCDPSR